MKNIFREECGGRVIWVAIGGNKVLFIEGTSDDTNGDLKQGFNKLLSQKLKGNMPKIIMGDNTTETLRKFRNYKDGKGFVLIDLDDCEPKKASRLEEYKLKTGKYVFFMIQEMEARFLS